MKQFLVTCGIIPQSGECKFGEKCSPKMCPEFVHILSDKQKIVEIIKHHVSYIDLIDHAEHRFVGKAENGKYFYLWGEKYLTNGLIPIINLENENNGIMYFNSIEYAIEVFNTVLEIIEFSEKELLGIFKFGVNSVSYKAVLLNNKVCYFNREIDEIEILDNVNTLGFIHYYECGDLYYENYLGLFIKLKEDDIL